MNDLQKAFARRNIDGAGGVLAGVATTYNFSITGQIILAQEQVPFFNSVPDVAVSANHAILAPVQTPASGWTIAQLNEYFRDHPAPAVNMNVTNASVASIIASMTLYTVRRTPDGKSTSTDLQLSTLLNAQDFQNTRVQAALSGDTMYDGISYPRLAWNMVNPAATLLVSWSFGASLDLRKQVATAAPVLMG